VVDSDLALKKKQKVPASEKIKAACKTVPTSRQEEVSTWNQSLEFICNYQHK
jgi:hypothetical protein